MNGNTKTNPTLARLIQISATVGTVLAVSCGAGDQDQDEELRAVSSAAAIAGSWHIPASTMALGNAQYVAYDSAGPWDGGAHCAGSMTPGALTLRTYLTSTFSQISGIGGYSCRQNTASTSQMSVHGTGRALDIFIPRDGGQADNDAGDPVANWLIENSESVGVQYIIWDRWRWNSSRSAGNKDAAYTGPHPHDDHIHVELSIAAGRKQTDFFAGPMTPPEPPPPEIPAACEVGAPYQPQFCDDDGHWAEGMINYIYDEGITVGCATVNGKPKFCTADTANRAQTIVMLARATDVPTTGNPVVFTDMAGFEWAAPAANAALAYNITTGCGATTFCPGDPATRSHVAAFIVRAYALPAASQDYFDDDNASQFQDSHNRLAEAGLTMGCRPREFCGGNDVTRAELAVLIGRAHQLGILPNWVEEPEPPPPVEIDPIEEPPQTEDVGTPDVGPDLAPPDDIGLEDQGEQLDGSEVPDVSVPDLDVGVGPESDGAAMDVGGDEGAPNGAGGSSQDEGCTCSTPATRSSGTDWWALALLVVGVGSRRHWRKSNSGG